MAAVTIYHRTDHHGRFMEASFGDPTYEMAYAYQTDRTGLEHIWRDNNVLDGWEWPVKFETRSLSVGDMVAIGSKFWTVANFGFDEVTAGWAEAHTTVKEEV